MEKSYVICFAYLIVHQVEIGVSHSGQIHAMNNHFEISTVCAGVFSFHFNFCFFP